MGEEVGRGDELLLKRLAWAGLFVVFDCPESFCCLIASVERNIILVDPGKNAPTSSFFPLFTSSIYPWAGLGESVVYLLNL
jgi:hypothetical protein